MQYTAAYNRGELRAVPILGSHYDTSHPGVAPSRNAVTPGRSQPNQQGSSSGNSPATLLSSIGSSDEEYWSQVADDVTELMDQVKI